MPLIKAETADGLRRSNAKLAESLCFAWRTAASIFCIAAAEMLGAQRAVSN
jgi:hypothetical protein